MLLTGVYQLPFGAGRRFLAGKGWRNALLGGWDITNVTLLETGPWLTPSISAGGCQVALSANGNCAVANDQSNTNVVNRGALLRPDVVSNQFYRNQSRAQYFNLAAFAATPLNAGRVSATPASASCKAPELLTLPLERTNHRRLRRPSEWRGQDAMRLCAMPREPLE